MKKLASFIIRYDLLRYRNGDETRKGRLAAAIMAYRETYRTEGQPSRTVGS